MTNQTAFSNRETASFPHCDPRVLHAPTLCEFCDERGDLQRLRVSWAINFTGQHDASKTTCPAEKARGLENLYAWGGNRAKPTVASWALKLATDLQNGFRVPVGETWAMAAAKIIAVALENAPAY